MNGHGTTTDASSGPMGIPATSSGPDSWVLSGTAAGRPGHLWIEPTSRCNTRCRYCRHFDSDFGVDMSEDAFARIRDSALSGARTVDLVGYGEPLLAPLFDRLLETCLARRLAVGFVTNGILLHNDDRVAQLVRRNVCVTLSIEGARAETHEFLRPYAKWPTVLGALECLKRHADAAGAARRYTLALNVVPVRHTVAELAPIVALAARYGARTVHLQPLVEGTCATSGLEGESLASAPELLAEPLMRAMREAMRLGVELRVPLALRDALLSGASDLPPLRAWLARNRRRAVLALCYLRQRGPAEAIRRAARELGRRPVASAARACLLPWQSTYFAADGSVAPCCATSESLGDLACQEWPAIWNGSAYRNLRRTVHGWNPTASCRYCGFSAGINGGDARRYERYFARFRAQEVALDSPGLAFGAGFSLVERHADGTPSHCWMARRGTFELPGPPAARFLRLTVVPRCPEPQLNPGRCRIGGGAWMYFDNSCPDLHFPLPRAGSGRIRVEIEMERAPSTPHDPRPLGLAIRGVAHLLLGRRD